MLDQNYDRWKTASPPENDDVSPCCGDDYTDEVDEEGFEVFTCDNCGDEFDEPIPQWEYDEQTRDYWAELRSDEERLERDE
tara:strand:+ start:1354 stop:1596 length:243 start_codon:yes stop_codon:yes gene_type:complete